MCFAPNAGNKSRRKAHSAPFAALLWPLAVWLRKIARIFLNSHLKPLANNSQPAFD